jgi:aminoglycoside phosphotransferase (APT) family kinase protein
MGWDERLRFNASDPPADGLAAMARELPGRPRAEVVEVRRLTGGVDAATHAVRLEPGGWVVVKRVRAPKAGSLAGELDRLAFARRVPVATPEPIALDVEGAWFGHPALVMGLVAGEAVFHPVIGDWIDQLAEALAAVHSTPLGDGDGDADGDGEVPRALRDPHAGVAWQPAPASELARTAQVEALVQAGLSLRADPGADRGGTVLLHHDFHHGNVLCRGDRVAGVLDWNEARLGPALCDVGYCSVDLAMTTGRPPPTASPAPTPRRPARHSTISPAGSASGRPTPCAGSATGSPASTSRASTSRLPSSAAASPPSPITSSPASERWCPRAGGLGSSPEATGVGPVRP